MREFSPKEQFIIKNRLIEGATLPGLFSDHFLENGKLVIQINASGHHRFDFYSDTISGREANEELVDVINLLSYLSKEGLVAKYPPAALTLRDFNADQQISIGNSKSIKSERFLLDSESKSLVKFLQRHDNYFFKASEPLRILNQRNFHSLQELQFERTIRATNRSQFISVAIAVATLVFTATINLITWNRSDKSSDTLRAELVALQWQLSSIHAWDSVASVGVGKKIEGLNVRIDSVVQSLKPRIKKSTRASTKKVAVAK